MHGISSEAGRSVLRVDRALEVARGMNRYGAGQGAKAE